MSTIIQVKSLESSISKDELYEKLRKELSEISNNLHTPFWYEVFIDFNERYDDELYPKIKDMKYDDAVTYCLGFLVRMELFYDSSAYYEFLNNALNNIVELK